MDAIKRSKNEWWKTEQDRKGKHLERKPASLRDTVIPGVRNKITDVESAKVRYSPPPPSPPPTHTHTAEVSF
jgi:hypothetical protein